ELGRVGVAVGVERLCGDLGDHLRLHQALDEAVSEVRTAGIGRNHEGVDQQYRDYIGDNEAYRLCGLCCGEGVADPGHGQAQMTVVEVFDIAFAVDVAQVRTQGLEHAAGPFYPARCAAREAAPLIVEQQRQGFVRCI